MLLTSCGYVTDKAQRVKERTAKEARDIKARATQELGDYLDETFGTGDPYTPDTRGNRHRFHECFDTLVVPDARDIYCFGDYIGIDYTLMFSFTCDTSSLARMIERKGLVIWKDDGNPSTISSPGLSGSWEFDWWKPEALKDLTPFYRPLSEDQRFDHDHIYLWYDSLNHQATYQQFSM